MAGNVAGQETAIGARVRDGLVLLVQGLRQSERALGTESVQAIGVSLEFGEVIQAGRRHAMLGPLDGDNVRPARPRPRYDFRRGLAVNRQPLLPLALLEPEIDTAVAPPLPGIKFGMDLQVVLRHEIPNGDLALHQHRQSRRLDPPDREHFVLVVIKRVSAGEIHADQPVGSAARTRCRSQVVVAAAGLQILESTVDGIGRQR